MAMESTSRRTSTSIQDDWFEVDDIGSVRSLSTSTTGDDHLVPKGADDIGSASVSGSLSVVSDGRSYIRNESDEAGSAASAFDARSTRPSDGAPSTPTADAGPVDTMRAYADRADAPVVDTPAVIDMTDRLENTPDPSKPRAYTYEDEHASSPDNTRTVHSSSVHGEDPVTALKELRKVHATLSDISAVLSERIEKMITFRVPIMHQIQHACHTLLDQLQELSPMVRAYADHWNNSGPRSIDEVPQTISLGYWRNELQTCLTGLWVQVEMTLVHGLTGTAVQLEETCSKLTELSQTMSEFLPLITCEYNEFRTGSMNFPQEEDETQKNPDGTQLASLRKELYELRDEIRELLYMIGHLHERISSTTTKPPIQDRIYQLISAFSSLNDGMNLILTNNYSDWIESDLGGSPRKIISHLAFTSLSPDMLRDVTAHLKQISSALSLQSDEKLEGFADMRAQGPPEEEFPSMRDIHQIEYLANKGHIDEIQSTVDFLKSLLMPETESAEL